MNLQSAGSHSYFPRSVIDVFARAVLAVALIVPSMNVSADDEVPVTPIPADALTVIPKVNEPVVLKTPVEPIITKFTILPNDWSRLNPTKVSSMFREIERRVNATNPVFPIVILDDDSINLRPTNNEPTFRNRFHEILKDRGIELFWHQKSDTLEYFGGLKGPTRRDPIATRIRADDGKDSKVPVLDDGVVQNTVCLVVPQRADLSSRSLIESWLGRAGQNYQEAKIDPGPYAMMLRSVWHEVWHCIDPEFFQDIKVLKQSTDSALEKSYKVHLGEVFGDVAATLTMASMGYLHIARDMADIRAVSSSWNGRRSMRGVRSVDDSYYDGVTYYLTRAQDLMDKHIREAGPETVARYSIADIQRIAREVTLQAALNKEEFKLVADYYMRGDAVIAELRAQNGAGAAKADFLVGVRDRAKQARQRLLTDTGRPVEQTKRREDEDHYDFVDILRDMPQEEKDSIAKVVKERADAAATNGLRREQGALDLIDEWRNEIHTSEDRKPEIERKLYVLSLMLSYGQLEKELGREHVKRKANIVDTKPEATVPPPEPLPVPDFTPKYKWEPVPIEGSQAKTSYKLGLG